MNYVRSKKLIIFVVVGITISITSYYFFVKCCRANNILWGAYVGDSSNLGAFESLVGKPVNLYADFVGWTENFPFNLSAPIGQKGKILIIFWEPNFGYDAIINGSQDPYIKQFAADAKSYTYPVILVPFDEMNLNEAAWEYGQNGNTAAKFKTAWIHIHDLFRGDYNVKFGLDYNNTDIPLVAGNYYDDYYPGSAYVDYVGVDGFNFANEANPWQTFGQIFDASMAKLATYNKPIFIFSVGSGEGPQKAAWITESLGSHIKNYKNLVGWVWFNQGGSPDWLVNSDSASLNAFKNVIP